MRRTTKRGPAPLSRRLSKRESAKPAPLRFDNLAGVKKYIKKNKLRVVETHQHTRGARIQVVDKKGKARTISLETRRNGNNN